MVIERINRIFDQVDSQNQKFEDSYNQSNQK